MKELDPKQQEEFQGLRYFEIFKRRGQPLPQYRFERGFPQETAEDLARVREQLLEECRKANLGKTFKGGGLWL